MTLGKSLHMHQEQSPHPRVDLRGVRAANANGCKGRGQGSGGALALRLLGALRSFGYCPQNGGRGGRERRQVSTGCSGKCRRFILGSGQVFQEKRLFCVCFFSFSCHQAFYFRKGKCPIRWIFRLSCGVVLGFLSMKQFWRRSTLSVREVARFALVGFFWLGFSLEPSAK